VATPEVIYTHEFFYRPSDLPDAEPQPDSDVKTESEAGDIEDSE
jgi:hypothetical protein